jgi:multidrug efflux pump subunit AcrA (membrane-fusion protein)
VARRRRAAVLLSASGYLKAHRQITVSSKAQGKIVEMAVAENQRVAAGDLIARLESDEARAQLALAMAEHNDAVRALRRVPRPCRRRRELAGRARQGAGRAKEVAARSATSRASRSTTARSARRSTGTVIRKIRDVGEFLTIGVNAEGDPGTAVVTLADLSAIEVRSRSGESEIRKVSLGASRS